MFKKYLRQTFLYVTTGVAILSEYAGLLPSWINIGLGFVGGVLKHVPKILDEDKEEEVPK
jgi:hypothetical protein